MASRSTASVSKRWTILADDSDSEDSARTPVPTPVPTSAAAATAVKSKSKKSVASAIPVKTPTPEKDLDSILEALQKGEDWADTILGKPLPVAHVPVRKTRIPIKMGTGTDHHRTWDDLEKEPWASKLRETWSDHYDCSALTRPEWEAMMSWLYKAGWDVHRYSLETIEFQEAQLESKEWVYIRYESRRAFCRNGPECWMRKCAFFHGDTFPRDSAPCSFGARCSRRKTCVYTHPDDKDPFVHRSA